MKARSLIWTALFWVAALSLTFWVTQSPRGQLALSAALCALTPLLAMITVKLSGGHVVISGDRSETRPDASALLMLPSLALAIAALGTRHIIDWRVILADAAAIAVIWTSLAYWAEAFRTARSRITIFIFLSLVGVAYGYGVLHAMDTIPDQGQPKVEQVMVLRKYIGAGRGHTPYLVLSPWSLNRGGGDESVSAATYEKADVNQKVCVFEYPGFIDLAWYEVESCGPKAPA